jgi:hypothetical protein
LPQQFLTAAHDETATPQAPVAATSFQIFVATINTQVGDAAILPNPRLRLQLLYKWLQQFLTAAHDETATSQAPVGATAFEIIVATINTQVGDATILPNQQSRQSLLHGLRRLFLHISPLRQ